MGRVQYGGVGAHRFERKPPPNGAQVRRAGFALEMDAFQALLADVIHPLHKITKRNVTHARSTPPNAESANNSLSTSILVCASPK
jgi:hypothetical protein